MAATMTDDDVIEGEAFEVSSNTAIAALNSSEIDTQISTAKMYPRSLKAFRNEALEMATLDEATAQECMYALKRGGKTLEGPSVRLAEIIASAWGNCRSGARVISRDAKFVTSQGIFLDLQKNAAISFEVQRRITDKYGKTYNDDMIGVTSNAACSIALRNAVFRGVPKAVWWPIYSAARQTAIGDASTLEQRRTKCLQAFAKMGVDEPMLLQYLEVPGVQDIGLDHLALLLGVFNAIKEGEQKIDNVFAPPSGTTGAKVRKSDLEDQLAAKPATNPSPAAKPEAKPATTDGGPTIEELAANGEYERTEPDDKPKGPAKQSSMLDGNGGQPGYYDSGE